MYLVEALLSVAKVKKLRLRGYFIPYFVIFTPFLYPQNNATNIFSAILISVWNKMAMIFVLIIIIV